MNRFRTTFGFTLVLSTVLSIGSIFLFAVRSEAICLYRTRQVEQFYGYVDRSGQTYSQLEPSFIPKVPPQLMGERIRECDGSVTTWGHIDVPELNKVITREPCDQVCE
jgi:hypothetical protein